MHQRRERTILCNMSFAQNSVLIKHQRTHTGLKDLSWHKCGKKFRQRSINNEQTDEIKIEIKEESIHNI